MLPALIGGLAQSIIPQVAGGAIQQIAGGLTGGGQPGIGGGLASSLIGQGAPIVRPRVSTQLDFEGEMVAVIGKSGRHIRKEDALSHVAGYSIFNDASIRDYQFKSAQWTIGKNFDHTGAFGPEFVTADALPPGCRPWASDRYSIWRPPISS